MEGRGEAEVNSPEEICGNHTLGKTLVNECPILPFYCPAVPRVGTPFGTLTTTRNYYSLHYLLSLEEEASHFCGLYGVSLQAGRRGLTSRVDTGQHAFLLVAIQDDAAQAIRRI